MPTNITEQEKQELLNIGQWGNKKGEQAWNKQCDKMKKARDGSYPDDWYQLIIVGDLYTKPLKANITMHSSHLEAAVSAGTHNAASKYMRGAGSSAWLDDSASHREARKQREERKQRETADKILIGDVDWVNDMIAASATAAGYTVAPLSPPTVSRQPTRGCTSPSRHDL